MDIQKTSQIYHQKIYSFLKKYLAKKAKEAKKTAPETFYFINAANSFILDGQRNEAEPILAYSTYKSLGGREDKKFLDIAAALSLTYHFFTIHQITNWEKQGLKNSLVSDVFKKYKGDKSKKDPSHIAFSQVLVLGDIVSGFGYELIVNSKFSDLQKIKVLEELNNIIKWHQIAKLMELEGRRDKKWQASREKYLIIGPMRIGACLANKNPKHEILFYPAQGRGKKI